MYLNIKTARCHSPRLPTGKKREMGQGRSYGVELYVQKTLGRTTGTVSYTLSKTDRIFRDGTINNGKRFPFVYDRRHNFCVSLNQKLGKEWT